METCYVAREPREDIYGSSLHNLGAEFSVRVSTRPDGARVLFSSPDQLASSPHGSSARQPLILCFLRACCKQF